MQQQTEAGVRQLKTQLSAYLSQVKAGGTVLITEYGRPIGRIVPVVESIEDRLEQLSQAGVIVWSGQPLLQRTQMAETTGPRTVADLLLEDRE